MFKVECESCKAPFDVDERRLPPSGAKMRCPKCGTSFHVSPPGAAAAPPPPPKPTLAPPRAPAPKTVPPKSTMLGLGMPSRPAPAPPAPTLAKSIIPGRAGRSLTPTPNAGDFGLDLDLPPPPKPIAVADAELPSLDDIFPDPKTAGDDLPPLPIAPPLRSGGGVSKLSSPMSPPAAPARFLSMPPAPSSEEPTAFMREAATTGELDLPMPSLDLDLPAPKLDLDLPAPKLDLDLPMPTGSAPDLPALKDAIDLPAPRMSFGELDLPAVAQSIDLPAPKESVDLPRPVAHASAGFGDLDLPAPKLRPDHRKTGAELPVPDLDGFDLPAPPSAGGLPTPGDLPLPSADLPLPQADAPAAFGEIELPAGDDMEFGDIPQAPGAPRSAPVGLAVDAPAPAAAATTGNAAAAARRIEAARRAEERGAGLDQRTRLRRSLVTGAAAAVLLVGGGAALSMTAAGPFGRYAVEQLLPAAGSTNEARATITRAEQQAQSDTYTDVRASLATLALARRSTGLQRELLARSVVHEGLYQNRFGDDPTSSTRIAQILSRLEERGNDAPGMDLTRAADALRRRAYADAARYATQARTSAPQDAYADLVLGEALFAQQQFPAAAQAFRTAVTHHAGARGLWGLARALDAVASTATDRDAAQAARTEAATTIDALLVASASHAGGRTLKARYLMETGNDAAARALLEEVIGRRAVGQDMLITSKLERATGLSLLGQLLVRQKHYRDAHEIYNAAIALDAGKLDVLLGDGRALLAIGDYTEALARFEAISPTGAGATTMYEGRTLVQQAKLGNAEALVKLERMQEAKTLLAALLQELPSDVDVLLAAGHVSEVLGDHAAAEQQYRDVIRNAPARFEGYLALAHLFAATSREKEAAVVLEDCTRNVPESSEMRRARGDAELERNRLDEARTQYARAIELDGDNARALFGMGVTERRSHNYEHAAQVLEHLAQVDPAYPGLDLERGMVFEARGLAAQAVRSYTAALAEHPDDMDLQLRLGAAQVSAGELDAAEQTLARVRDARPNSADVAHFTGRLALARGSLEEARAQLQRAVQLDGTRAEFHLYAAWVARDQNSFDAALEEIEAAIARDPSLGDAFWIRGDVRLRAGAVRNALEDFDQALRLKPSRAEAHAGRAEALDQLRQRRDAIAAYERAVSMMPERGDWWHRLGQLRWDEGNRAGAFDAFSHAVQLGEVLTPPPAWLADTHRLYGDALRLGGDRTAAISHYEKYLQIAPPSAIDRDDVTRSLAELRR